LTETNLQISHTVRHPDTGAPSPRFFDSTPALELFGVNSMHLNELKALHVSEVLKQAEALEIENTGRMRKQ
jgi:hypothetical protein